MTEDWENLDGIPAELAETIRVIWRQAETIASSGDPIKSAIKSGLMPKPGDFRASLHTYNERFLRLKMKLDIIPKAIATLRSIDPKVQPRLYQYMVTVYLDVLKYDIKNVTEKSAVRRMIERTWIRLSQRYAQ